ncbi:Rossmann-like domain-containing protein [Ramlibacter alkalitolerans]|uniref:Heavy-metal chelation domain-containing protein n=1 Tax=Ramlibacter alkalitolerans TaxID=2039631 RepID=A0ABS1JN79_9BURK|nr:DUF364 domain-containing protein [Ramlibacter alkalitolerans]MBL0425723.1 hypothetical protein [Ramlibacter alkalitolerans]
MTFGSARGWLLDAARRIDDALGSSRVQRLVLPPLLDRPGKEGEFCALQLDDGSVGLSFTLLDGTLRTLHARSALAAGMPAAELVAGYASDDGAARALGLAAINALTRRLCRLAGFEAGDSVDSFGSLALAAGDRLGMVGHFSPLIRQARALGIPVVVVELKPELVREEPGLVVTLDPGRLAGCNKIVSTSTVLLNDTFEEVAGAWRHAEAVAIVGPSAGCPPDALFAAGVSAVGTAWVTDADAFLARVAAGEKWGDAARKVTITAQAYPGLERLLAAALSSRRAGEVDSQNS